MTMPAWHRLSIELESEASSTGAESNSALRDASLVDAEAHHSGPASTSAPASAQPTWLEQTSFQAQTAHQNGGAVHDDGADRSRHQHQPSAAASPFAWGCPQENGADGTSPRGYSDYLAQQASLSQVRQLAHARSASQHSLHRDVLPKNCCLSVCS